MAEFNQRLHCAGADEHLVFYPWAIPHWLPPSETGQLYNEYFLALDGDTVRGAYAIKHQDFLFPDGIVRNIGYYHHPLSEGIVNKAHALVGTLLLRDAMMRSPLLYCLGMGGYENPLPQMLIRLGWTHCLIPFWFQIVRPARFLREMKAVRSSLMRRLAMDIAAFSGAGWLALQIFNAVRKVRVRGCQCQAIIEFGDWTDLVWQSARGSYSLTAVRDSTILQTLYPSSEQHLTRLRVTQNGAEIGWAVVGEKRQDAKYGSMRVGSIVDCFASPDNAFPVIRSAAESLREQGMDLIITNQSHSSWCGALAKSGFLQSESNFIFAASKKLAELIQPFDNQKCHMHFTRADGDGLPRNY